MKDFIIKLKLLKYLNFKQQISMSFALLLKILEKKVIPKNTIGMSNVLTYFQRKQFSVHKIGNQNLVHFTLEGSQSDTAVYLRRDTSDFDVFEQVFISEQYKPLIDIIKKRNLSISSIIDAGANVGYSSIYLNSFFPDAKVIAIEPHSGNFEMIKKNIQVNNLKNVHPIQAGVWFKNEQLQIHNDTSQYKGEWSFFLKPSDPSVKESGVKGITIDDILQKHDLDHVDILKIDIEGAEKYLFTDKDVAYKTVGKAKLLAIEIHDEGEERYKIVSLIEALGFSHICFGEVYFCFKN